MCCRVRSIYNHCGIDSDDSCYNSQLITFINHNNFFSIFFIIFSDEAQKKLEEYATKDCKSSSTKKTPDTNGNQHKTNVGKNSKRSNVKKRSDKTNYSHNWLLTTLKGHTGSVMDMSFSSNGKYLATCADGELQMLLIYAIPDFLLTPHVHYKFIIMTRRDCTAGMA